MPNKPWKSAERKFAAWFGSFRNPLSGSASRHTAGDMIHEDLFLDSKHREKMAVVTLFEETAVKAKREGKTPVLGLHVKGSSRHLIVCDIKDLKWIAEYVTEGND